jgi:hypothetical protein
MGASHWRKMCYTRTTRKQRLGFIAAPIVVNIIADIAATIAFH